MIINSMMALLSNLLFKSVNISFYILLGLYLFSGCSQTTTKQEEAFNQEELSQQIFDAIIKTDSLNTSKKFDLLGQITTDSLYAELIFDLSYHYYKSGDSLQFRFWNNKARELGKDNKEILGEAHWDLGNFFYRENGIDSSYFHYYRAYTLYKDIEDQYYAARMSLNMAILQENVKDYIGSEVSTINAIKIFEELDKKKQQYIAYTNLGVVSNGLDYYPNAIGYHEQAISIARDMEDSNLEATSLNNLGVVYENKKKFDSAVYYYKKALDIKEIQQENPRLYAMLLDNLAFSQFKIAPNEEAIKLSLQALEIRDRIQHVSGQIINKLHLAEMEKYYGHSDTVVKILSETRRLAEETNNFDYLLESLVRLSEVDSLRSSEYFDKYQLLNDSLLKEERLVRNKFARIRYETNEYIEENKLLSQQQIYLGSIFIVSIVLVILLFYQKELRAKNRELTFQSEQQAANEKIYDLILSEQIKMEEAKDQERQRISGDLHDGILGKLFATRISLGIIGHKFLSVASESRKTYDDYIAEIQLIEKEIRTISHDLKNDVRDHETFIQLVQNLVDKTQQITSIQICFEADKNIQWEDIGNNRLINLYRILQEIIQNAIKHAQAKNLKIEFLQEGEELKLLVEDDGKGFKKNTKKGIGLKNMQSRVAQLQGNLHIQSTDQGVRINIVIPICETKHER